MYSREFIVVQPVTRTHELTRKSANAMSRYSYSSPCSHFGLLFNGSGRESGEFEREFKERKYRRNIVECMHCALCRLFYTWARLTRWWPLAAFLYPVFLFSLWKMEALPILANSPDGWCNFIKFILRQRSTAIIHFFLIPDSDKTNKGKDLRSAFSSETQELNLRPEKLESNKEKARSLCTGVSRERSYWDNM
jgi:hypothetical protein